MDCINNPNYYRTIDHLQIIEHSGALYGVFERFRGDEEYDGICFFKYVINDLKVSPGYDSAADLSNFLKNEVETKPCLIPSSKYGSTRLKKLHLDVGKDINLLFIPKTKKKVNNECIFFGIIDDKGAYVNCPSAPINVQGKVGNIFTFYRTEGELIHPIRIYNVERPESNDKLECAVDNQGHWGLP